METVKSLIDLVNRTEATTFEEIQKQYRQLIMLDKLTEAKLFFEALTKQHYHSMEILLGVKEMRLFYEFYKLT